MTETPKFIRRSCQLLEGKKSNLEFHTLAVAVDHCFACRLGGALLLQLCSAGAGAGAVEAKSWFHYRYGFRTQIFKNNIQVAMEGFFLQLIAFRLCKFGVKKRA